MVRTSINLTLEIVLKLHLLSQIRARRKLAVV